MQKLIELPRNTRSQIAYDSPAIPVTTTQSHQLIIIFSLILPFMLRIVDSIKAYFTHALH